MIFFSKISTAAAGGVFIPGNIIWSSMPENDVEKWNKKLQLQSVQTTLKMWYHLIL